MKKRRITKWMKIVLAAIAVVSVALGGFAGYTYLQPPPGEYETPKVIQENVRVGSPLIVVRTYLALRHIGYKILDNTAAMNAYGVANRDEYRAKELLVGGLPGPNNIGIVIEVAVPVSYCPTTNASETTFFFNKASILVGYRTWYSLGGGLCQNERPRGRRV